MILLILLFATGCQQTDVLEPDGLYKQKVAVFASLKADSTFGGITFTRTLPLTEEYDIKKAEITDITAYLKIDGIQVIPLLYVKDGLYKPKYNLIIKEGSTYELFASYAGKSIYSNTSVPQIPKIISAQKINNQYFQASVSPKANEVYGLAWTIPGITAYSVLGFSNDFPEIVKPSDAGLNSNITLKTIDIPENYRTEFYFRSASIRAYAFDKSYYDYFLTKANNQQISNSFVQGGGQIIWNVYGEDVIGLFIGMAIGGNYKPQ